MKKALIIIGSVLLAAIVGVGGYGFYLYKSVQSTVDEQMHLPIEREKSEKRPVEVDMSSGDPLSFLLMGVDARDADRGRTDTLMVITVNPKKNSMKMLSIPRDTRTEIVGRGFLDKINHAYAFGGPEMSIDTVENFLDIPIDYFVTVNMEGFKDIVDALGGVTVHNEFAFSQSGYTFDEGEIFLNGDEALAYSRMRKQDPRGDFGRNDRHRKVVMGMVEAGAQMSNLTKTGPILRSLGDNVSTNLSFDEMLKIANNYRNARHNVEELTLSGSGTMIDSIYYYIVPEEERLRVSEVLKEHLELEGESDSQVTMK